MWVRSVLRRPTARRVRGALVAPAEQGQPGAKEAPPASTVRAATTRAGARGAVERRARQVAGPLEQWRTQAFTMVRAPTETPARLRQNVFFTMMLLSNQEHAKTTPGRRTRPAAAVFAMGGTEALLRASPSK